MLAVPVYAQRGGGGNGGGMGGGGGFRGGGMGGGGFRGGIGGFGSRGFGGFHGGFNRFSFNRFGFNRFGFNNSFGFNNGFGGGGIGYWGDPSWDWGWSGDYPFDRGYGYPYNGGYASQAYNTAPAQQSSPGVNIIYGTPPAPAYTARANPVIHEYDWGQQAQQPSGAASSPVYLIAFQNDHAIRAAASYWVDGQTLHYVTLQHEEKLAPLGSIDRALTLQLNRERSVTFQLP
jgi:hypothetical protein